MKLTIKTKDIEIEYQDDYSNITKEVKERIEQLIEATYRYQAESRPIGIFKQPDSKSSAAPF